MKPKLIKFSIAGLLIFASFTRIYADSIHPYKPAHTIPNPIQFHGPTVYVIRVRDTMRRILDELKIPLNRQTSGAIWAAQNHLDFSRLAILEIDSKYMKGYRELSDVEKKTFDKNSTELREPLERLGNYLANGEDADFPLETKPPAESDEFRIIHA